MEVFDIEPESSGIAGHFPWEPIKLIPLGDIQAGVATCDTDMLARTVERGLREDAWSIGMGDYLDVASPSNRKAFKAAGFYDSIHQAMDDHMLREEEKLMNILAPTKGRWFGMLEGHHTWEYEDGSTTDINLCRALGTKFLGQCTMLRLWFRDDSRHTAGCVIWAHHGQGSGTSMAAPITKLERVVEWAEADLYLLGHMHKRAAANVPRFYLTNTRDPKILARERLLVGTGSYLKGYMQGSKHNGRAGGTYVEAAMMRPVSLGSPIISIIPDMKDGNTMIRFEAVT